MYIISVIMHLCSNIVDSILKLELFRSFRDYGESVLKHLENSINADPKLQKAPVNYEGVC